MRTIPNRASLIITSLMLQEAQLRAAAVPARKRHDAMMPGLEALLQQFDDELLEAQRESARMLAAALDMRGR